MLFLLLMGFLNLSASEISRENFKAYTEVTQVEEFSLYSDYEKCIISKWVHQNNSDFVRLMYSNGYKVHPNRIQTTSDDVKVFCQASDLANRAPHQARCGRYENCESYSDILRMLIEN